MQVWVKQKAQETWQFLSSSPSPALYLFLWPSVPVSLLKEHTASLYAVSVCCCSLLYHASLPNLPWSLFTSRFAQNGQWKRRVLHLVTSPFIFWAVFTPLPPYMKSVDVEYRSWGVISYEKSPTSTTKHGPWPGRQKTNRKEKLPYLSLGEDVCNTYAHPWFLPGRAPRQPFSSSSIREPCLLE